MILRPGFSPPSRKLDYSEVVHLLLAKAKDETNLPRRDESPRVNLPRTTEHSLNNHTFASNEVSEVQSMPGGNVRAQSRNEDGMISLFGGELVVPVNQVSSTNSGTANNLSRPAVPQHRRTAQPPPGQATIDQFFGGGSKPPAAASSPTPKRRRTSEPARVQVVADRPSAASPSRSLQSMSELYAGIASVSRNIAVSEKSLAGFLQLLEHATTCAVGVLWPDGSSSHSSLTTKYCTPSMECSRWNCACDRTIRITAMRGPIAFLVFALDIPGSKHAEAMYLLPISCDVDELGSTLPQGQRIQLISQVLASDKPKVIFNSHITLLALLLLAPNSSVSSIADPRIAAFLCDSDSSEASLELTALTQRYKAAASTDSLPHSLGRLTRSTMDFFHELKTVLALQKTLDELLVSKNAQRVFVEIEMPLVVCLVHMERMGIGIDYAKLKSLQRVVEDNLQSIAEDVAEYSHGMVNLSSPEQVADLLFGKLNLPVQGQGKRHASTSEEALMKIRGMHPVVQHILDYRAFSKLLSTYILSLEQFIVRSRDGQQFTLHAVWKQTSVRTGRLSCCRPNLQNLPQDQIIRGVDIQMRSIFIAPTPGYLLISADYSQIEMRVLAQVTGDPILCEIFRAGGDIYVKLASQIFHKPEAAIEKVERTRAKTICLGVIYGMGVKSAAAKLDISVKEASQITNSFFSKFSRVQEWMIATKRQASNHGYVETISGRRRHLSEADDAQSRAAVDRQAVNSVVQGSASDVIKTAMLLVRQRLDTEGLHTAQLVMQVHDEIVVECSPEQDTLARVIRCIRDTMETSVAEKAGITQVPLRVSVSVGRNFAEMEEVAND